MLMFGWNFVKLKCKVASIFKGGALAKSKKNISEKKGLGLVRGVAFTPTSPHQKVI